MKNIKPINPFTTLGKYQLGERCLESSIVRDDVVGVSVEGQSIELSGSGWLELWRGLINRGYKQITVLENAAELNAEYLKWRKQNRRACGKA
jgi:hypothetical protein